MTSTDQPANPWATGRQTDRTIPDDEKKTGDVMPGSVLWELGHGHLNHVTVIQMCTGIILVGPDSLEPDILTLRPFTAEARPL